MNVMTISEIKSGLTKIREISRDLDNILPMLCCSAVVHYADKASPRVGDNAVLNEVWSTIKLLKGVQATQFTKWIKAMLPIHYEKEKGFGKKLKGESLLKWTRNAEGIDWQKFLVDHPDFREWKKDKIEVAIEGVFDLSKEEKGINAIIRRIQSEVLEVGGTLPPHLLVEVDSAIAKLFQAAKEAAKTAMDAKTLAELSSANKASEEEVKEAA